MTNQVCRTTNRRPVSKSPIRRQLAADINTREIAERRVAYADIRE
jgi:hypothetical protein